MVDCLLDGNKGFTYPRNLVASTLIRYQTTLRQQSLGTMYTNLTSALTFCGWADLGSGVFRSGFDKGTDKKEQSYADESWYQPQYLAIFDTRSDGIYVKIFHTNNAFAPSPEIKIAVIPTSTYRIFADPFSLYVLHQDFEGFGICFSMSALHLTCQHRSSLRTSINVFANNSSQFLWRGHVGESAGVVNFCASKNEVLGSYSWSGLGVAAPRTIAPRSFRARVLNYTGAYQNFTKWIASPAILGWGDPPSGGAKLRGFLWNMQYFYGTFALGTILKNGFETYEVIGTHAGASLAWKIS